MKTSRMAVPFLALVLGLWASAAAAEVKLEHTIQKVVHKSGSGGAAPGADETTLVPADRAIPGDELVYTITFTNNGAKAVDAGSVVVTNPIPAELEYLPGTAFGAGTTVSFSTDGGKTFAEPNRLTAVVDGATVAAPVTAYTTIRWTFAPALAPGASSTVSFHARLK